MAEGFAFVTGVNLAEAFFTSKIERCCLATLQKKDAAGIVNSIRDDVALLPTNLPQISPNQLLIEKVLGGSYRENVSLASLDEMKNILAPLMKYKREKPSLVIELGLDDVIDLRKWVIVKNEGQKVMVEE